MSELEHKLRMAGTLAGKGKVSRRDFVQLAAAAGFTFAAANAMFTKAVRAEPRKGGSARFGLAHGATTDTLDPVGYPDTFTQCAFWGALSNSLTEVDAKGNVVADLASSYEPSDGARKWVFKLRKGLTFHNGQSLTADDVVASVRHHMGPDSRSAVKSLLDPITEIASDGPDTVVFTLQDGNADFPYLVSDCHLPIMPTKDGKSDWQSGVRSGPFTLVNFEPGVSAKLKRNPNYHKPSQPYLDEVEFLAIADVAARTNALATGDVDFIGRADLRTLDLLKRDPNIEILELSGYGHNALPMNTTLPPFDNNDVRTAIKWAVDREEIRKKIFLGHATVGNDNPIAKSMKYAVDLDSRYEYNPDKAKFHLKKAGYDSLKVDLSVADAAFAGATDAGILIKETMARCGIDVNVIREAEDAYWDNVWMKRPWCASYWNGRATADWMFTMGYAAGAPWNETFWKNDRFNDLLVQGRAELDDAKRAAIYAEMQQLVHDDGGVVVLSFNNFVTAHLKRLAHGDVAPNWENDGLKIAERWWLA
ncbi:MAG: ABC transporter substrate-binding protein [Parvibaculaceae bacterium]